jgi:hypothetical protein
MKRPLPLRGHNALFDNSNCHALNFAVQSIEANARFRPWSETWSMIGCDRTIDVQVDFVPDERGTQIILPEGMKK